MKAPRVTLADVLVFAVGAGFALFVAYEIIHVIYLAGVAVGSGS